jgi:hypothetical protein
VLRCAHVGCAHKRLVRGGLQEGALVAAQLREQDLRGRVRVRSRMHVDVHVDVDVHVHTFMAKWVRSGAGNLCVESLHLPHKLTGLLR